MDIGARLKEARVAKGVSLDHLQETTKIQKRYLTAIEEGNFHILPGKFYARAFIKEYANAVGLDPNELLEEHEEEIPKTEEESGVEQTRIERTRKESNARKTPAFFSFLPTIFTVLVVIGILFAAWYFIQQSMADDGTNDPVNQDDNEVVINNSDDDNEDNQQANEETDEPEETDQTEEMDGSTGTEPELSVVEEGTGESPESTLALTNVEDELIFTLESDGNTWLDIQTGDGEVVFSGSFGAEDSPEELDLSGAEQISFNIGNAPDLDMMINGVELEYPIDPSERVHQRLTINVE